MKHFLKQGQEIALNKLLIAFTATAFTVIAFKVTKTFSAFNIIIFRNWMFLVINGTSGGFIALIHIEGEARVFFF